MNKRAVGFTLGVASAGVMCMGCAPTRRINVTSDPSGALVYLNDVEVGRTPVEVDFTWFGVYDVRLRKDGYEPLVTTADAEPRWHDQPGGDVIALLLPGGSETYIDWHFDLEPLSQDVDGLIARASETRLQIEGPATEAPQAVFVEPAEEPVEVVE